MLAVSATTRSDLIIEIGSDLRVLVRQCPFRLFIMLRTGNWDLGNYWCQNTYSDEEILF